LKLAHQVWRKVASSFWAKFNRSCKLLLNSS